MGIEDAVLVLKVLGDETRLKIVSLLLKETMCACELLEYFQCTQPTLSYHMKQLMQVNLVTSKKEGKWMKYSIQSQQVDDLTYFITHLSQFTNIKKG